MSDKQATGRRNTAKCPCGCGQAPAASCRLRLVRCSCGNLARQSRQSITLGPLGCPCGDQLQAVCLEDRTVAGDEAAYQACVDRGTRHLRPKRVGVRHTFQCHGCRRLLKSPVELCRNCGYLNDPRPGCGGYVEGVSSCGEAMPF